MVGSGYEISVCLLHPIMMIADGNERLIRSSGGVVSSLACPCIAFTQAQAKIKHCCGTDYSSLVDC